MRMWLVTLSLTLDECLKNIKSSPRQGPFNIPRRGAECMEERHGSKTTLCAVRKAFRKLGKLLARVHNKQLILYRHATAGYMAFVVTWLFSSLAKVPPLMQDLQRLSSDDHVIQWICLHKNNVSSDTKKWKPQEARSMILGCVPLTTSVYIGLRYPLLMWNA